MNDPNPNPLDRLAARCAADPFFLASALAAYQQRPGLDDGPSPPCGLRPRRR
jgi:hypothetical protein